MYQVSLLDNLFGGGKPKHQGSPSSEATVSTRKTHFSRRTHFLRLALKQTCAFVLQKFRYSNKLIWLNLACYWTPPNHGRMPMNVQLPRGLITSILSQATILESYPWQTAQGADLDRFHLAASRIQASYRSYMARKAAQLFQRAAQEKALQESRDLAWQRSQTSRLLKRQANDVLLAVYAQSQYSRTRDRIMQARRSQVRGRLPPSQYLPDLLKSQFS